MSEFIKCLIALTSVYGVLAIPVMIKVGFRKFKFKRLFAMIATSWLTFSILVTLDRLVRYIWS